MSDIHVKLGEVLKLERENRKIDLETVSDQLKISIENLQFVEDGDIENAPSELYFGLFAKSYAEFLGIDYTATMEAIKDEFGEVELAPKPGNGDSKESRKEKDDGDEELPSEEETKPKDNKKLLGWIGIGLGVVIVALLVWILAFGGGVDTGLNASAGDNAEQATEPETEQAYDQIANYEFGTPPANAPEPIHFRMIASEPSWSTVLADGDTAVFRSLTPGRQYDVDADYRLMISIALPRVVRTWINGTEVNLRDPESRRISRVEVTQINLAEVLAPRENAQPAVPVQSTPVVPPAPKPQPSTTPATTTTTTSTPQDSTPPNPPVTEDTTAPAEDSVEQL